LLAHALAMTYFAKKRAEIAPGVGTTTDIHLITRSGWEPIRPDTMEKAAELYKEFEEARAAHATKIIKELNDFLAKAPPPPSSPPPPPTEPTPTDQA
jgi:hypothetical protein